MNLFKVTWETFTRLLLPDRLRQPKVLALLRSAMAPVRSLYALFVRNRADRLFLLKYDTGKRNLELALRFRFYNEGIYVRNWRPSEGLFLNFYTDDFITNAGYVPDIETAYLPRYTEFFLDRVLPSPDFTIYVPLAIWELKKEEIYDFAAYFVLPAFRYNVRGY